MAARVNFSGSAASRDQQASSDPPKKEGGQRKTTTMVLPITLLEEMRGRRVTCFLNHGGVELEGTLLDVMADRSLLLENVSRFNIPGGISDGQRITAAVCKRALVNSVFIKLVVAKQG